MHKLLTVPKAQNSMQNLTIRVDQMFLSLEMNGFDIFGFWNHPTLLKLCFAQRFPNVSPSSCLSSIPTPQSCPWDALQYNKGS